MKSAEMIGWAIGGLEREIAATRERLANLTAQANALRAKLPAASRGASTSGITASDSVAESRPGRRRKMSAEARRRISEMMTKRWAERRSANGGGGEGAAAPARKRKRRMSAEARKRISDAQKKRWAEHRKAAK